jgi:hypothetical protein
MAPFLFIDCANSVKNMFWLTNSSAIPVVLLIDLVLEEQHLIEMDPFSLEG